MVTLGDLAQFTLLAGVFVVVVGLVLSAFAALTGR